MDPDKLASEKPADLDLHFFKIGLAFSMVRINLFCTNEIFQPFNTA